LPPLPARIAPRTIPGLACGAGFGVCGCITGAAADFAAEPPITPTRDNSPPRVAAFACETVWDGKRAPSSRDEVDSLGATGAPAASVWLAFRAYDGALEEGAACGDGAEFVCGAGAVTGAELAGGRASRRDIAISFAGAAGFRMRKAIPVMASNATSAAAAGINQPAPVSHAHAPAFFFSAAPVSPTPPARAIAASCSRQCEQREKCKS
jgi:hypothetical protein